MKKSIISLAGAVVLSLGLCWFVGQQLKQARQDGQESQDGQGSQEGQVSEIQVQEDGGWDLRDHVDSEGVVLNGRVESDDYPYGFNVGAIEDDEVGRAVLLTPGTGIEIDGVVTGDAVLEFSYEIHPWVAQDSDGALLNIQVASGVGSEEYVCEVSGNVQKQVISLAEFTGSEIHMSVTVDNEEGRNESCDWVILRQFVVPEGGFAVGQAVGGGLQDTVPTESGGGSGEARPGETQAGTEQRMFYDAGYVRSATYFSDEWPLNFWNSEMDEIDAEMRRIREDGFESIILVIPWREFQPGTSPVAYNEEAFRKLDTVMEAADRAGLGVYARVGYIWDYYNDSEDVRERFFRLMGGGEMREAWYHYIEEIHTALCAHENFREGFLTWEDFWNNLDICNETMEGWLQQDGKSMEDIRLEGAAVGYQQWVEENYGLQEYNLKYGTDYMAYLDIPIPGRDEPAMEAMYRFFDDFLNTLLADSQERFPNLSMEVRMDWDVMYGLDGEAKYYQHGSTYSCQESTFTTTMYGIPMGFENNGERVGYREAMEKTEYILKRLKQENGGKPVYIDQFIFADNTPLYSNNAQIREEELDKYLENIHTVLQEYSEGYGIWAYRNYRTNMLYNSQFALEGDGWNRSGDVSFAEKSGSMVCRLEQGGSIGQSVPMTRNHFDSGEYVLSFEVAEMEQAGKLTVSVGEESKSVEVDRTGEFELMFPKSGSFDVRIESDSCRVQIDNIRLYPYVHQGFLYDEDGGELECLDAVRTLNRLLGEGA